MSLTLKKEGKSLRDPKAIPIVCPVRNEESLLPHFIRHHRGLGIRNFIFIDNGSTDSTAAIIEDAPDCTLIETHDNYVEAKFGATWVSEVLNTYASGRWGIYLDCDEFLIFPEMEQVELDAFIETTAEASGADSFWAMMIDTYPDGQWEEFNLSDDTSILDQVGCFDKDYVVRKPPVRPYESESPHAIEVLGGPRMRLEMPLERAQSRGWMTYAVAGQVDRFVDKVPMSLMPALARYWPSPKMAQYKNPLNLITPGFKYGYSHGSSNRNRAPSMLAVMHVKFCDDLFKNIDPNFAYHHHYQRGLERFRLSEALKTWGDRPMVYEGTRQYQGSASLLEHGLIGEAPAAVWTEGLPSFRTGLGAH